MFISLRPQKYSRTNNLGWISYYFWLQLVSVCSVGDIVLTFQGDPPPPCPPPPPSPPLIPPPPIRCISSWTGPPSLCQRFHVSVLYIHIYIERSKHYIFRVISLFSTRVGVKLFVYIYINAFEETLVQTCVQGQNQWSIIIMILDYLILYWYST